MFRHRASDIPRLLAVAGFTALAACSDATAPAAAPPATPSAVDAAVYVTGTSRTADSVVVDFVVTPTGGWFTIGDNAVYFPANAICDPATSGYGPDTWDRPCQPAAGPVRIRARAGTRPGERGWVHFDTDLRFVPSDNPARWVTLFLEAREARKARPRNVEAVRAAYTIFWVPELGADPVDESRDDPTLVTRIHWGDGWVSRRVKHFSGYQVGEGRRATVEAGEETSY